MATPCSRGARLGTDPLGVLIPYAAGDGATGAPSGATGVASDSLTPEGFRMAVRPWVLVPVLQYRPDGILVALAVQDRHCPVHLVQAHDGAQ